MIKKYAPYLVAAFLAGFGLLTLFLSTSVILDLFGIRAKQGHYVLFVVWSNLVCGVLYLFAVYGIIKRKYWAIVLLALSSLILITAYIGLNIWINSGGSYETKTIEALVFRISVTLVFTGIVYLIVSNKK